MAPINKEDDNAKGSFKYCSQTESFSKEKKQALMCENRKLKLMKYLFLWKKKELFNILKKGLESQDNNQQIGIGMIVQLRQNSQGGRMKARTCGYDSYFAFVKNKSLR